MNALHRSIITNLGLQSSVLISRIEFFYQPAPAAPREVTRESQTEHGSHEITFGSLLSTGQTSPPSLQPRASQPCQAAG